MFKKTLLMSAVGAALGVSSAYADLAIDFDTNDWTREGAEAVTTFDVPDLTITLDAEYTVGDLLTISYSEEVDGDFASTINANETGYTLTLGKISEDETSVTYRVTELTADDVDDLSTVGADFDLGSDLTVSGDTIRAGEMMTATFSSVTAQTSIALESITSENLFSFEEQFGSGAVDAEFSAEIDVEPGVTVATRSVFVSGDGMDDASVEFSNSGATASNQAALDGVRVTVNGDFSFIVDEDTATAGTQSDALTATQGATTVSASYTDASTAVLTLETGSLDDVVVNFDNANNGDGTAAIKRGSFTVTGEILYTPVDGDMNSETVIDAADFGEWDINGSAVTVYAMPVSPNVDPFIWVTNNDDGEAPVRVTATTELGATVDLGVVKVVPGNSITRISQEVVDGLNDNGIIYGRVTLEVVTSAPGCSVNVAASYKVMGDADRLPLETSQTINGVHNTGNTGSADDLCVL